MPSGWKSGFFGRIFRSAGKENIPVEGPGQEMKALQQRKIALNEGQKILLTEFALPGSWSLKGEDSESELKGPSRITGKGSDACAALAEVRSSDSQDETIVPEKKGEETKQPWWLDVYPCRGGDHYPFDDPEGYSSGDDGDLGLPLVELRRKIKNDKEIKKKMQLEKQSKMQKEKEQSSSDVDIGICQDRPGHCGRFWTL